jgi:AraC-like DNA-binding protein
MEHDRIYLDPELTVEKLASIMHIPRKQLSQVLNEQFKQNFNSFINTIESLKLRN